MIGRRHIVHLVVWFSCCGLIGCGVDARPGGTDSSIPDTLGAVASRLSHTHSLTRLNHLATHGDALLKTLTRSERASLGRDYLKVVVREPMVVSIAAPADAPPFWLEDQGFAPTSRTLKNADATWRVYRKSVRAGEIGLGVNGLDRTPSAHYVAFFRSSTTPTKDARPSIELRDADAKAWRLVKADVDVSPAIDVHRPFESIPPELEGSTLLQSSHERRHASLLAPGRIWKTHVASGTIPDQVTIAFGADPTRELIWNWRTRPEITGSAIRLALVPDKEQSISRTEPPKSADLRFVSGESVLHETLCVLNDRAIRRHRVVVQGLAPDRTYLYSIGDGSPDAWGPWTEFRSPAVEAHQVKFLYLGDPQTGFEAWGRRLEAAYRQNPDVKFALIAGDLVDRGNERTNWDHFFLRSAGVFDRLPLMPSVGNHEYLDQGPRLFRMFFDLPANGPATSDSDLVYSFDYGDAFFAVLDSTMAVSSHSSVIEQAAWLDRALGQSKATWKFVMFHHPVYASRPKRDNRPLQEHWVPIFDKHHVDVVLQGHDHTYIRTHPLRDGHRVESSAEGTYYVVSVSGDKYYDQEARSEFAATRTHLSTYQIIELDADRKSLTYRSLAETGEVVDTFTIDKTANPKVANRLVDR